MAPDVEPVIVSPVIQALFAETNSRALLTVSSARIVDVAPEDEGLPSDIIKTDTTKADGKADTGTGGLTPEEQLMKSGMDSYIAALGEDVEVGSIEDYKNAPAKLA